MADRDNIQFRRVGGEWTAVYLNGELQQVGDSYLADEWLAEHYGVEVIDDGHQDCMIDNHKAYRTLDEVTRIAVARVERETRAAELRAQADELTRQAQEVLDGAR